MQYVDRIVGSKFGLYGNYYKNHEMSYITEETGWTRVGEAILERFKTDRDFIKKIEACNEAEIPVMLKYSRWFVDNDLTQKSGAELLKQHDLVYKQFMKVMEYSAMATAMEFERPLMSDYLETVLREKAIDKTKVGDYFNVLSTPNRSTTPQAEEIALRGLRIKELKGELLGRELKDHQEKYSHIAFGYDGPGWSLEEARTRLHALSNDIGQIEKEIEEIKSTPNKIKEKQKRAVVELNLNEQEAYLFNVLIILGYWKFERKLANQKSHEMMEKFFEELMRRFHLSKAQAKMIAPYEMEDVLIRERVDGDLFNERMKLSFAVFDGDKPGKVLVGSEARQIEQELLASLAVDPNIKEFAGTCAYPGKAVGVVKVVNDENEMNKFKVGDILVSTSTTPKIIPAMKKAAAIITDSGGITCHAAIVSRELNVPCVIGTKIATKVLKDGDRVEVDAANGTIKKI